MENPLDPKQISFELDVYENDGNNEISLFLTDHEYPENDNIREINHPDFEKYWDNIMENTFVTTHFLTLNEARLWLLSIGMTDISKNYDKHDLDKVYEYKNFDPYDLMSTEGLQNALNIAIKSENYELAAELRDKIKNKTNA